EYLLTCYLAHDFASLVMPPAERDRTRLGLNCALAVHRNSSCGEIIERLHAARVDAALGLKVHAGSIARPALSCRDRLNFLKGQEATRPIERNRTSQRHARRLKKNTTHQKYPKTMIVYIPSRSGMRYFYSGLFGCAIRFESSKPTI